MTHITPTQATRLKALGFDKPTRDYYDARKILRKTTYEDNYSKIGNKYTSAPTPYEALDWFREVKGIDAWVEPYLFDGLKVYYYNYVGDILHFSSTLEYTSHPEALSALIDKLIEILEEQTKTERK